MELKKIAEDLYACLQEDKGIGCSNSGLISRKKSAMIIDTFYDLPRTREMISFYETEWSVIPDRVVNTHINGDHTFGNQLFPDAEIIAHSLCAKVFGSEDPKQMQFSKDQINSSNKIAATYAKSLQDFDFRGIQLRHPTVTFEDTLEVDVDGLRVELIYVGPAHTGGDIIVYVPEREVIFAGDVVFNQCTPVGWDGTYDIWFKALDKIIEYDPKVIVPGHGPLCDVKCAENLKEYFQFIRQESKKYFDEGLSTIETAKKIDIKKYAKWTEPQRILFNIERAYRELRGEAWNAPINAAGIYTGMIELSQFYTEKYS